MIKTNDKPRTTEQIRHELWSAFYKGTMETMISHLTMVIADNEARALAQSKLEDELQKLKGPNQPVA